MATAVVAESRYDPRCDTVEALDARLVSFAQSGAPLRRALARIAGELVRRRAWEPLGFVRPADYARERPGLSAREVYDLARADEALAKLPAIDAALTTGQLGWTKARLLCRVATPEDEARWLDAAGRLSAAALSREVRRVDVASLEAGGADPTDEEIPERAVLCVRAPRRVWTKWGDVMRALRRVTGEWLPTETCVELVAAEVISAIGLEVDLAEPPPVAQRARSGRADSVHAREPMVPPAAPAPSSPFIEALVAGLEAAGPFELDRRLCRAAALERGLLARMGLLLLAFANLRGAHQLGFRSLDAYARERLGMSARKARALLRLERACALAAVLGEAWREGRITCSQVQALVPLVLAQGSEPFHAAWIERAAEVAVRRLEDDVEHALATGAFDPALLADLPELVLPDLANLDDPLDLPEGMQIGAEPRGREETDVWVANVPADVARLFRACLCSVARRLNTTPGRALEAMFDHAMATWWVSSPRAYRVFARDGWRCTVPGCTSQRNLHAHHVLFRPRGSTVSPSYRRAPRARPPPRRPRSRRRGSARGTARGRSRSGRRRARGPRAAGRARGAGRSSWWRPAHRA
jgi:hypothetical protein